MEIKRISGILNDDLNMKMQEIVEGIEEAEEKLKKESDVSSNSVEFDQTNENDFVEFDDNVELSDIPNSDVKKEAENIEENIYSSSTSSSTKDVSSKSISSNEANENEVKEEAEEKNTLNNMLSDEKLDISEFRLVISASSKLKNLANQKGYGTLFDTLDKNHDGYISEKEIKNISASSKNINNLNLSDIESYLNNTVGEKESQVNSKTAKSKNVSKEKTSNNTKTSSYSAPQAAPSSSSSNTPYYINMLGRSTSSANKTENVSDKQADIDDRINELQEQKDEKQTELDTKQTELDTLTKGEDEETKKLKDNVKTTKEAYDKACDKSWNIIVKIIKAKQDKNEAKITEIEGKITEQNEAINENTTAKFEQDQLVSQYGSQISALETSISDLEAAKSSTDDTDKQNKIQAQIISLQKQKALLEEKKEKASEESNKCQTAITNAKTELDNLNNEKNECINTRNELNEKMEKWANKTVKEALKNYTEAQNALDNKLQENNAKIESLRSEISTLQNDISEINNEINELEKEKIIEENKASSLDFNFEENMSDKQKAELEEFLSNYKENIERYKNMEKETGIPAELIAALHWRESNGNFNTYMQNGDPLGQTTVHVPKGIYCETWEESAKLALSNSYYGEVDKDDIETYYNYAEKYNGLGYRNKGLPSPYVWAGTSNYTSGKYVADGVFDADYVDQQLGVALMLKSLLS